MKLVLAAPLMVVAAFLAYLSIDKKRVENVARGCSEVIVEIESFKNEYEKYPTQLDVKDFLLPYSNCHYINQGDSYDVFVSGGIFSLQVYEYRSETGVWAWD